jgi:hypothetical protein
MYPYSYPNIFSRGLNLTKSIKWGTILDGTQKTLGVINQAIPLIYQAKPLVNNAKTLFKIANIMNDTTVSNNNKVETKTTSNNSPIFYI